MRGSMQQWRKAHRPLALPVGSQDKIVSHLDHHGRIMVVFAVPRHRVVDPIRRRVGFVDANGEPTLCS